MKRLKITLLSALMLFCAGQAQAQAYAQSRTVCDSLYSKALGTEMPFRVSLPDGYSPDKKYVCLYTLDSYNLFDFAAVNARYEQMGGDGTNELPPMIVVAIDYKPVGHRNMVGLDNETTMHLNALGQKFQKYIADELIPHIDATYSTAKRFLMGHSWTAVYPLWWMLNSPDTFAGYLMLCPADDDPVPQSLLDKIDIRGHRVSIVAAENDDAHRVVFADSIANTLSRQSPYIYHTVVAGESHMSVVPIAVTKAMRSMFADAAALGLERYNNDTVQLSQNAWQIYRQADSLSRAQYGTPLQTSDDVVYHLFNIAFNQQDPQNLRRLADTFEQTMLPLDDYNVADMFFYLNEPQPEEGVKWADRAIAGSRLRKTSQDPYTETMARDIKAMSYTAAYKHDYAAAWKELETIYATDSVSMNYGKGKISAEYNFRSEEGLKCLDAFLAATGGRTGFRATEIYYLRAKCLMNMGKLNDALVSVDVAIQTPIDKSFIASFRDKLTAQCKELKEQIEAKMKK